MSEVRHHELVERALAASRTEACIAIANARTTANLRWAGNTLTTNGVAETHELTFIAVDGPRVGVVTRSGAGPNDVGDIVAEAEQAAREQSAQAEDASPLVVDSVAANGWSDPPAATSIRQFATVAPALGEAFAHARANASALYGYAEHDVVTTYLGTSTGLRLRHDQPSGRFEATARSADGTRSAWTGEASRDLRELDVAAHAGKLAQRLQWSKRRVELPAGRYDAVLPPAAVADLLVYLYWSAGALDAHEGHTVFSRPGGGTRVGDRLCALPLTLSSDPRLPGQQCAPFVVATASSRVASVFDNGLPTGRVDWIHDGRLAALVQTRHSARVTGLPVTPFTDNLTLTADGQGGSLDDLVAGTRRGLLLTCLWYVREVDPQTLLLTGLTRDGVFLVEDGEVVGAVNNFRFNESPVAMLSRVVAVGDTEPTLAREVGDYFAGTSMPPLRVTEFNMSTVSQAS